MSKDRLTSGLETLVVNDGEESGKDQYTQEAAVGTNKETLK